MSIVRGPNQGGVAVVVHMVGVCLVLDELIYDLPGWGKKLELIDQHEAARSAGEGVERNRERGGEGGRRNVLGLGLGLQLGLRLGLGLGLGKFLSDYG